MSNTVNPITTAVRSWLLRSPARLALGVFVAVAVAVALRALVGAVAGDTATTTTAAVSPTPAAATTAAAPEVDEVTEADVAAMSAASVTATPARAAMYYAHVFLDADSAPARWALDLAKVTDDGNITDRLTAARPTTDVTIIGSTRTTTTPGDAGTRVAVDTSSGELTATLTDTDGRWLVDTPLPTLSLDALPTPTTVDRTAVGPTEINTAPPAPARVPAPPTSTEAPSPTDTAPPMEFPAPLQPAPAPVPAPVPVPGPIPIPDLDTPLPGPLA